MSSVSPEPDDDPNLARPTWACQLCPPPRTRAWVQADSGFCTCAPCYDKIRSRLKEVAARYLQLDPRPGGSGEQGGRGAPGFGSRPPANVSIIAMRDPRSSTDSHVWVGGDGRVHSEEEHPPLSVQSVLSTVAWSIAEHRRVDGPPDTANTFDLVRFIDRHADYLTRHQSLAVELDEALRALLAQLKPRTGDGRKRIGTCPNTLDEGQHSRECGATLYAPLANSGSDAIRCPACGRTWNSDEWLELGTLLTEAG